MENRARYTESLKKFLDLTYMTCSDIYRWCL